MTGARLLCSMTSVVLLAVLVSTSAATAATYTVQSCRTPTGAVAPASDAAGGWAVERLGPSRDARDHCASADPALIGSIGGTLPVPVGTAVGWRFSAPAGTLVAAYRVLYSGYARPYNGQNQGVIQVWGSDSGLDASHEGSGSVPQRWAGRDALHDRWVEVLAWCDGPVGAPDCPPYQQHSSFAIRRSEVVLSDDEPPGSSAPTGSAAELSTWQGTQTLAFRATDSGSGVHQALLTVDGNVVQARTLDDWDGRCVDTTAGQRVFTYPQPCPSAVDAVFPIDASALPAGPHEVALQITDAAGNLRTVFAARRTMVGSGSTIGPGSDPAARGAANGDNASDSARLSARWTRTAKPMLSISYGSRGTIRGRLSTADHVGIRNARIELLAVIDARGGAPLDKGGARTRGDGRFTLVLPRNLSSRRLVLIYRSHVNDTVAVASKALRLRVRAGVTLRISPRRARQGRSIRLTGRLVGGPVPPAGKIVELQARDPGSRWITFRTLRTSTTGHYRGRYTFRRPGPAVFEMRVRVRESSDYPYSTGLSRTVRVRVH
jgi:hypothetical protein